MFEFSRNGWHYKIKFNDETGDIVSIQKNYVLQQSIIEKAKSYITAEASRFIPGVDVDVESRKAACSSCHSCDKQEENKWFCNSCGCPKWDRSRLQVKWEMPAAHCPLSRWPKVESSDASSRD
jgi:hypothetical protein